MSENANEKAELEARLDVLRQELRSARNELAVERAASLAIRQELEYVNSNLTGLQEMGTELLEEGRRMTRALEGAERFAIDCAASPGTAADKSASLYFVSKKIRSAIDG
jgi:hypothetical protein